MKENKLKEVKHISIIMILIIILVSVVIIVGVVYLNSQNKKDNCTYKKTNYNNDFFSPSNGSGASFDKPVIYIYPEEEMQVEVVLGKKENITCSYPKYENSWIVNAKPDGTLTEIKNPSRELYSLYYECLNTKKYNNANLEEGFVVKSDEVAKFLEDKLTVLGLNDKESEEFIIYWLPKLESNKYVYIRFQSMEEIENVMPLYIDKTPDTLIRVMMEWKGLEKPIDVKQQELTPVKRNGYTVVEWGGTELK